MQTKLFPTLNEPGFEMYTDDSLPRHIPFLNVPKGASTSLYLQGLIFFLERFLPAFTSERKVNASQNENDLTEQLYCHLRRKAKINEDNIQYPYEFQTEKGQKSRVGKGHSRRVDIAIRLNTMDIDMEVIYCLEAKKLPTDKPTGARSKEYVVGKGGAIERFKNEFHGLDDKGQPLGQNGIVAYVCEESFEFWHAQINSWIDEADWFESEKLVVHDFGAIGRLLSFHPCNSGRQIQLDHFWVII